VISLQVRDFVYIAWEAFKSSLSLFEKKKLKEGRKNNKNHYINGDTDYKKKITKHKDINLQQK
jgi:hypothetical protein